MEPEDNVTSLDRYRMVKEFEGDPSVAYLEILWGTKSFAVNAAIQDLEEVRSGNTEGELRDPETEYEMRTLIERSRWVMNYLAREFGLEDQVRPEDWTGDERPKKQD